MDSARYALADQHHFVVRAIRGMLADPNAAEDAAQDAWLGALRRGGSYGVGWLVQAARHAGLDGRRRDAARGAREARDARERGEAFAEAPDAALERVERRQRVAETVLQLDEPLRAVVLLRYEEGRTCVDIASRLGIDETTVRRRLARAHEELKRRLDHEFGDRAAWAGLAAPLGVGQTWAAGTPLVLTAGLVVAAGVAFLALLTLLRPSDGASSDSGASLGALSATPETRNGEGLALRAGSAEFDRAPAALVVQEPRPVSDAAPRAAATHERLLARAELLDRKRFDDYERATFSFQHGRRDDPGLEVTGNDWELLYSGGAFDVVTVVDDQSWIAPLGALDPLKLAESLPKELRWSNGRQPDARVMAEPMGTYLVLSRDTETDLATVFRVVELRGDRVVLDWYTTDGTGRAQGSFADDGEGEPLVRTLARVREEWRAARPLREPVVRLQLRCNGAGGNPRTIDLAGDALAYVRRVSPTPLDLATPVEEASEDLAFANGGFLPRGQALRVTSIELVRHRAAGAARLPRPEVMVGGLIVPLGRVGEFEPYSLDGAAPLPELLAFDEEERDRWTGELFVQPGLEPETRVELCDAGAVEVVLRGTFVPAVIDPRAGFGPPNAGFFVTPPYVAPPAPPLTLPRAVLQLRAGAQGAVQSSVDLTGRCQDVDHVREVRLDLAVPPRRSDPSEAFADGGCVPEGKVFVITDVTWYGAAGVEGGAGLVEVRVGDEVLVSREDSAEPFKGAWHGALTVARGEESLVRVSVSSSSYVHVELEGELRDAPKLVDPPVVPGAGR